MNKHDFYKLAGIQGQHRFPRETFKEFEKRVLDLQQKRGTRVESWRVENAEVANRK